MADIKKTFINYAVEHGESIEHGDHKSSNKLHGKLYALYERIKRTECWDDLKHLVKHPDDNVRLWSATFLLKHDTDHALQVLDELKKSEKITGLTASTIIDMWNKGMLQL